MKTFQVEGFLKSRNFLQLAFHVVFTISMGIYLLNATCSPIKGQGLGVKTNSITEMTSRSICYASEDCQIDIALTDVKVKHSNVTLRAMTGIYVDGEETPRDIKSFEVNLQIDADKRTSFIVHPMWIGKVNIGLFILYNDGQIDTKDIDVQVVAPDKTPLKIISMQPGGMKSTIHTPLTKDNLIPGAIWGIYAIYDEKDGPVLIPRNLLQTEIIASNQDSPPFHMDQSINDDYLYAMADHTGHALVKSSFDGLSVLTCIAVETEHDWLLMDHGDHTTCSELIPAGMDKIPPY
jgi:hypothetical protein